MDAVFLQTDSPVPYHSRKKWDLLLPALWPATLGTNVCTCLNMELHSWSTGNRKSGFNWQSGNLFNLPCIFISRIMNWQISSCVEVWCEFNCAVIRNNFNEPNHILVTGFRRHDACGFIGLQIVNCGSAIKIRGTRRDLTNLDFHLQFFGFQPSDIHGYNKKRNITTELSNNVIEGKERDLNICN